MIMLWLCDDINAYDDYMMIIWWIRDIHPPKHGDLSGFKMKKRWLGNGVPLGLRSYATNQRMAIKSGGARPGSAGQLDQCDVYPIGMSHCWLGFSNKNEWHLRILTSNVGIRFWRFGMFSRGCMGVCFFLLGDARAGGWIIWEQLYFRIFSPLTCAIIRIILRLNLSPHPRKIITDLFWSLMIRAGNGKSIIYVQ